MRERTIMEFVEASHQERWEMPKPMGQEMEGSEGTQQRKWVPGEQRKMTGGDHHLTKNADQGKPTEEQATDTAQYQKTI